MKSGDSAEKKKSIEAVRKLLESGGVSIGDALQRECARELGEYRSEDLGPTLEDLDSLADKFERICGGPEITPEDDLVAAQALRDYVDLRRRIWEVITTTDDADLRKTMIGLYANRPREERGVGK